MRIKVNGVETEVRGPSLSYEDVAFLAAYEAERVLSITYRTASDGTDHRREGILTRGQSVTVAPGMIFNCYNTSRA